MSPGIAFCPSSETQVLTPQDKCLSIFIESVPMSFVERAVDKLYKKLFLRHCIAEIRSTT